MTKGQAIVAGILDFVVDTLNRGIAVKLTPENDDEARFLLRLCNCLKAHNVSAYFEATGGEYPFALVIEVLP